MKTATALLIVSAALLTAGCAGAPADFSSALQPPGYEQPVATLVNAKETVWEPLEPQPRFAPKTVQHLRLKSGTATVQFNSGVTVTLTAPAEFAITSQSRGDLRSGAATVRTPDVAHGFTLDLPSASLAELGGEFSATVLPDGTSTVRVTAGNVHLITDSPKPTLINAGSEFKLGAKAPPKPAPWEEQPVEKK